MKHLGAELTALGSGKCEIHVRHRGELTQQHGYFHGGVTASIADSASGYAAYTMMPGGFQRACGGIQNQFCCAGGGKSVDCSRPRFAFGQDAEDLRCGRFCREGQTGNSVRDFPFHHHGASRPVRHLPIQPPSRQVIRYQRVYIRADLGAKMRETIRLQAAFQFR